MNKKIALLKSLSFIHLNFLEKMNKNSDSKYIKFLSDVLRRQSNHFHHLKESDENENYVSSKKHNDLKWQINFTPVENIGKE